MAKNKIQKRMLPTSPERTAERDAFISGGKAKQPLASKKPRAGTSSLLKKTQKEMLLKYTEKNESEQKA